ncbi:MAG TPA: sigma-70 family RNA polymerase sigma factor [Polyangiaceae bacterium]|nr:sigma-70 family RNA polymerase sigma factor [Polyangiaceae bacterium]
MGEFRARGVPLPEDLEAVDALLDAMFESGRAAWPAVMLEQAVFAAWIAERLPGGDPNQTLLAMRALHAPDLYLACACALGDGNAIVAFEGAMRPVAERALARLAQADSLHDDARQTLLTKLLVSVDGAPPRITEYSGRGALASWFRVAVTRQALSALRSAKREVALDEDAEEVVTMTSCSRADPELSHLRRQFSAEFTEAFDHAVRSLESAERNLLRHHYLDGLSIDEIGAIYRIHRVTAARRLTRAREALVQATRRLLAERLHATPSELRSAMRVLDGAVDITLRRALRATQRSLQEKK